MTDTFARYPITSIDMVGSPFGSGDTYVGTWTFEVQQCADVAPTIMIGPLWVGAKNIKCMTTTQEFRIVVKDPCLEAVFDMTPTADDGSIRGELRNQGILRSYRDETVERTWSFTQTDNIFSY